MKKTSRFACFSDARDGHLVNGSTMSQSPESLHERPVYYVNQAVDFSHACAKIDIAKHALSISGEKIDNSIHQRNRHREAGFVDFRCDFHLLEATSVDVHTNFSCDFSYENQPRVTRA